MSASLNRIVLCGNLTRDPELSYTPSGMAIVRLGMAVNERVKDQQGEWKDRPCFVDVTAFGGQAEACNKYLEKGSPILLEGKLRYESWEAKDGGGKRSKHSVVADRVQFLSSREGGSDSAASAGAPIQAPKAPLSDAKDDEEAPPF
ncbi:single-stranded DNA-binding protein [Kiritimatiellaeota bacterium B1221]|nr:single-stranded DNA-binding protein [Kiritimatiellaeota bacterium B1221]